MILQIMVKEIGRTEEEKQAIGRMKMLEEIAKEVCKGKHITSMMDYIYVQNFKTKVNEIIAISDKNKVLITKPKHEVDAYNLALACETYDGKEWTLKKDYDEPDSEEETFNN